MKTTLSIERTRGKTRRKRSILCLDGDFQTGISVRLEQLLNIASCSLEPAYGSLEPQSIVDASVPDLSRNEANGDWLLLVSILR